jgi:hypothetical protein
LSDKIGWLVSTLTPLSEKKQRHFYMLIGLFVAAQLMKLFFLAPEPETFGDAAIKWSLAKNFFADGSLEMFSSLDYVSHHYLRWASWLFASGFVWAFGDSIVVYYLSTFLPATLAAVIFLSLCFRHIGIIAVFFLALFWFFDPQLNRALFQLLPTGAGLLPLALMCLSISRFADGKLLERSLVLWLSVCIFWLYGAKETNIFFAPGVFAVVWIFAGRRHAFNFVAICLFLYFVEAVTLSFLQGQAMVRGRLFELLSDNSRHLQAMLTSSRLIEEQEALWDAGILSRWYTVNLVHVPINLLSILTFIIVVISGLRVPPGDITARVAFAIALIGLSFVVMTSFFIVSLDPVRLGQPIRERYIAILLPLSTFILFYAVQQLYLQHIFRRFGVYILVVALLFALGHLSHNREYRDAFLYKARVVLTFDYRTRNTLASWIIHFKHLETNLPDR